MLTPSWSFSWLGASLVLAAVGGIYLLTVRYQRGLREIPGPLLASVLPLDRVATTFSGHQFQKHLEYHQKYGPVVRVGPNHVSVADSDQISIIYSITSKFGKVSHSQRRRTGH